MANAIAKISKRAKAIQRATPGKPWKRCIREASAEYRSGKIGAKRSNRQTGSSNRKRDKQRKALAPGKRKSATGKTYYERRKNRSDVPGRLSGVSAATLTSELKRRKKDQLAKALLNRDLATKKTIRKKHQKTVTAIKADLKKLD